MKRFVLKIGSSSLTDEHGLIDSAVLQALADAVNQSGAQIAIVSSGAVAAGVGLLGRGRPRNLPEKQAFAAVGQALLMQSWRTAFAPTPVAQFLLSADDIHDRRRFINAKQALEAAFKLGLIPIINENDTVATEELKLGDNDTLSAWVAYLIDADALFLLTDVDGLYSANPKVDPNAQRISLVSDIHQVLHLAGDAGSARGTGGMRTKLKAAMVAAEAGIETHILSGAAAGLSATWAGAQRGTRVLASRHAARRGWILHKPNRGILTVDAGAARALQSGKSLLASGITCVSGDFDFGDALAICCGAEKLGQGLSNYKASELKRILGKKSDEIEAILGYKDFDEVIHRNQLALYEHRKPAEPPVAITADE